MAELKKNESGIYLVGFETDYGKRWRSTGERTLTRAKSVVDAARIEKIELAAKAKALTSETLSAIMAGRRVTCSEVLQEWEGWRREGGVAENTIASQKVWIQKFIEDNRLESKTVSVIDDVLISRWVNADDAGVRSTRAARLSSIRTFFTLASARAYCVGNPSKSVKVNHRRMSQEQRETERRQPFTEAEYRKIVAHTEGFWWTAVQLGWWTGLRLSDIAALEWSSIKAGQIIIHTTKRDARVTLSIYDSAIGGGVLDFVLVGLERKDPRFVFPYEAALIVDPSRRSLFSVQFKRILDRLQIYGKSFHSLRHSFVTRCERDGIDIECVGKLVGHRDKATTAGYSH